MAKDTILLNNGVEMPLVGLGTWPYKGEELQQVMETAWALGYRHFDTAWLYKNEVDIGKFIKRKGIDRSEIILTSKLNLNDLYWRGYHHRFNLRLKIKSARKAYEDTCRRLGVDYVDLYLIHWPFPGYLKMWESLNELYEKGKVRAIGVSSFMPKHLESLKQVSDVVPAVNQVEMNPFNSRNDVVDYCHENGIVPEAYSPLGRGRRTQELMANEQLLAISKECGKSVAQVVLRWLTQRGVMTIPRSNKEEKLRQNLTIFDFDLTAEQMDVINRLNRDDFIKGDSRNVPINGK